MKSDSEQPSLDSHHLRFPHSATKVTAFVHGSSYTRHPTKHRGHTSFSLQALPRSCPPLLNYNRWGSRWRKNSSTRQRSHGQYFVKWEAEWGTVAVCLRTDWPWPFSHCLAIYPSLQSLIRKEVSPARQWVSLDSHSFGQIASLATGKTQAISRYTSVFDGWIGMQDRGSK